MDLRCGCGEGVVFIFAMRLWCCFCSFYGLRCGCGSARARVANWDAAVVKLLVVELIAMLVWWSSCSFCDLRYCCDEVPGLFVVCDVVVVKPALAL